MPPPYRGHFEIARSVRLPVSVYLSVPWLRTRPRTDVDQPRFLPPSNCRRRERAYRLAATGAILVRLQSVRSLERVAHVVQGRSLYDNAERADQTGGREHPHEHRCGLLLHKPHVAWSVWLAAVNIHRNIVRPIATRSRTWRGIRVVGGREHPQEHSVEHHRHELPVLLYLHSQRDTAVHDIRLSNASN